MSTVAEVSLESRTGAPSEHAVDLETGSRYGWVPQLALASAAGVALVSVADALSRSGRPFAQPVFWLGLLVIFLPIAARLASTTARRGERVALVLVLGIAFYLVKVLHDPFAFASADELVHQHNVLAIIQSQALFGHNPILPVTPLYPGLEAVAAALTSAGGTSTFTAGLIVIGIARMILMLALFLLYESVTGSGRVAGVATALYAANPHYLFFDASFSYESFALPLAVLAVYAVARGTFPQLEYPRRWPARPYPLVNREWAIVAVAAICTVVVTHHITSYGLVAVLVAICLVPLSSHRVFAWRPWVFAATALAATAGWLVFVASRTVGYLSPVITNAIAETFRTAAGESQTRELFHSSTGQGTPASEHVVAIASTLVILAAIPFGLRLLWHRYRDQPVAMVLGCASVAYVGTLALRLVPAAWETGARASEFLWVGVALVVALAALEALRRLSPPRLVRVGVLAAAGVVLVGGIVSTTPHAGRIAEPYRVAAGGRDLDPPAVAVARWARHTLGPGQHVAAEKADARTLMVDGRQHVFAGAHPPIESVLQTPKLYEWQLNLLRRKGIRYVVVDAREASANVSIGYYFPRHPVGGQDRLPAAAVTKFERAGAHRIYDGGNIVVDDLRGVSNVAALP
jgi:hypothetical protein